MDKIETLFYHCTTCSAFLKGKRGDIWDFGTQSLCISLKQLGNPIMYVSLSKYQGSVEHVLRVCYVEFEYIRGKDSTFTSCGRHRRF